MHAIAEAHADTRTDVSTAAAVRDSSCNMPCPLQAIYHGKPVVGMPMLGDQASNADRVVAKVRPLCLRFPGGKLAV